MQGDDGIRAASGYWGRGIATVAVKAAVAEVFRDRLELERLEALVDVDNVASGEGWVHLGGLAQEGSTLCSGVGTGTW